MPRATTLEAGLGPGASAGRGPDAGVELEPLYYRDNFLRLCDTVEAQYGDLLLASELAFLSRYRALDAAAQCLYVRLVSRVGPHFRLAKLDYPEIGQVAAPAGRLEDAGLLATEAGIEADALGRLFTLAELRPAFADLLPADRPAGKAGLLCAIEALELAPDALLARLVSTAGRIVTPLEVETVALLQLLFFGNRRQSLTEFVLDELGVARYYPYPLDRARRLFCSRAALQEYLHCSALSDRFHEARESEDWPALAELGAELLVAPVEFPSTATRHARLCNRVARELERRGGDALALALYAESEQHPARERRARILERSGEPGQALALCEAIGADPWCEAERDAARRMQPRLRRLLGGSPRPRPRERFPTEEVSLPRGQASVELLAAQALAADWEVVRYVENGLMNGLFGLAFWEQIFAPVAGAFHNPYQAAPADMYQPGFRERRAQALEQRLQELGAGKLPELLALAWERYCGYQCRWVNWRLLDRELLDEVLDRVPASHLLAIWERMLFDPGENRRGFPDLVALGSAPGDYRLIEVKGPGDQLQDSQKRWLRYFAERAIPASVLRVSWLDD